MMQRILIFICSLIMCFSVFASEKNNRAALIIGIGEYETPEATPLPGVGADMESAKQIAKAMGIPDGNIVILRDHEATKINIVQAFKRFSTIASNGGRAFIYYSGHGTRSYDQNTKRCYEGLLSYDRQEITNEEIAEATKQLNQNVDKTIILFDSCHSGGVLKGNLTTRSANKSTLTPKFFTKSTDSELAMCSQSTNLRTRSVFDQSTRLGAIQENLVFITASRPDEVSYDEGQGKGGIATQAIRDCLLGKARDRNASGGITLEEIRVCSQELINQKLTGPMFLPHHVTIKGNRNLIPVVATPTQIASPASSATLNSETTSSLKPQENKPITNTETSNKPVVSIQTNTQLPATIIPSLQTPQSANIPASQGLAQNKPIKPPPPEKPLASIDTLRDIENQRNPTRVIEVVPKKTTLKINQDYLDLRIKSSHDGYAYIVLLGSDQKSFYVLYPNKLDKNNSIKAGQALQIPTKDWKIKAAGPVGKDHLLVMVTDSPRDLSYLEGLGADKNSPFVYTLADINGRSNLINYLTGKLGSDKSEKFGAKIITINEVK
jgi:hypothetical protein